MNFIECDDGHSHVVQGLRFKVYPRFNVIEDFVLGDDGHSHVVQGMGFRPPSKVLMQYRVLPYVMMVIHM